MKTVLTGLLTEVMPIEDKSSYKSQRLTVVVQEYDSTTGEPYKREVFQPMLFNKAIDSANAKKYEGKRVRITCFIRSLESAKDGKVFYNLALNATKIEEA